MSMREGVSVRLYFSDKMLGVVLQVFANGGFFLVHQALEVRGRGGFAVGRGQCGKGSLGGWRITSAVTGNIRTFVEGSRFSNGRRARSTALTRPRAPVFS